MNIRNLAWPGPLFGAIAEISGLAFEVWDRNLLVYSTRRDRLQREISCACGQLASLVIKGQSFQSHTTQDGYIIAGLPLRVEEEIVGALIVHDEAPLEASSWRPVSERLLLGKKILSGLAAFMEEKWSSQRESEKMVEELTQHLADLDLYSRISTQVKTLTFSKGTLRPLIGELLEAMRMDMAFSSYPDQEDYSIVTCKELPALKAVDPRAFAQTLVALIPTDAMSLREDYFIVNDSRLIPEYQRLHHEAYRFLAVAIRDDQAIFGWLGLVSFNMEEIFRQGELRLLKSLARSTAAALENTRLYRESLLMAEKERSLRNIFQKYVPAEVANELLDRGERELFHLGEKRRVTLLNVDIRGYSRMSKTLRPEDVVAILNFFFLLMGNAVISHRGIVDKYLGDGFLAVFGAPARTDNPALDATLAALDMLKHRDTVDEFTKSRFGIPINIGISINTGEVILGNIGFERKMEYTVIGDAVNDTFRLQEHTRKAPNSILISKKTREEVKSCICTRKLDSPLPGNKGGMEIYEVTGIL